MPSFPRLKRLSSSKVVACIRPCHQQRQEVPPEQQQREEGAQQEEDARTGSSRLPWSDPLPPSRGDSWNALPEAPVAQNDATATEATSSRATATALGTAAEAAASAAASAPAPAGTGTGAAAAEALDMQHVFTCACKSLQGVKIADFGLARFLGPNCGTTEVTGTLAYAAPEVVLGDSYDYSADLWSLGVLAFELLTSGRLPFTGKTPQEIKQRITRIEISFDSEESQPSSDDTEAIRGSLAGGSEAREFVLGLLAPKQRRMSCEEALMHPFLAE
ncbi:CAM rad domain-containing protein [Cyclospora cayetanensis]|uniref:CAM rad domain-containing protein n=1 Tax=Cyclospora cayetanensis TaxID=88456 RepID=A0A1D3D034_9EIME|nr:CAM rad domain-containing protein [Cyclospora cayetanensis]